MIGPGTGLAPFRAFLQERQLQAAEGKKLGPAMLFFGCRHPDQDFFYRQELEALAAKGLVELHVAFSRHGGEKTYVQDLLRKHRSRVWELIEAGGAYLCLRRRSRMEPDVKRALARSTPKKRTPVRQQPTPGWSRWAATTAMCWTCGQGIEPVRRRKA